MNFKVGYTGLLLLWFFYNEKLYSQIPDDSIIAEVIESIAANNSEELDYSEITERLYYYRNNPLDINTVSREHLQELVFLSPVQINSFLSHREKNGLFIDLMELQGLPGFGIESIRRLFYFVVLGERSELAAVSLHEIAEGKHDLIIRIGGLERSDPDENHYPGSDLKLFARYRFNYSHILAASLNLEKDSGEKFFSGKRNGGFDFYSANVSIRDKGLIRKLVLGDYALQFGQGLSLWSGLGFGKTAGLTSIARQEIGLRPYSSVNETSFFRGVSASLAIKDLLFTPFFSYKKIDAAISDTGREIKSFALSGLHRTETELKNKNSADQLVYGANLQYLYQGLSMGFTSYQTRLSLPFAAGDQLYQRYNFTGNSLTNLGFNYNYTLRNTYFFGEAGHSLNSGFAFINGFISSLSGQVSLALLHRNYARNYHSFFNQAVSESTSAVNEKGFFAGITIKFNPRWELITYTDFYRFPWLKFRADGPSQGYELFAQLNYTPNKRLKAGLRYKHGSKEENSEEVNTLNGLDAADKQNYRLELIYKINETFTLRNRAEIAQYGKGQPRPEFGFLSYQDIIFDPLNSKISGNIRFAIFDTEGFNSRIYTYENDVLYSHSVPAYQGSGLRYYFNGRYSISRGIDLWMRFSGIKYSGLSGKDPKSERSRGADIRFQVRFRF